MTKPVHIHQHDSSDCAVACVASVCAYYGKEFTIVKLRELLGTDILGTTILGIDAALEKIGFEDKSGRVTRESFESGFTLPAIAHIVRPDGSSHFVVIYKINTRRQVVTIMDPAEDKLIKKNIDEFFNDFDGIIVMMIPKSDFKPSKVKSNSIITNFVNLIKPHRNLFTVAVIASIVLTIFGVLLSLFNKILIDEIIPYHQEHQLLLFAIGLAFVIIINAILGYARQAMLIYLSLKIDIPMMLGYFKHIFHLPMNFFASRKTGDMMTRFQDAGVVKNIFTNSALSAMIDVMLVVIVGFILYFLDWHLFVIIIVLAALSALLIYFFKSPYKKLNKESMEQGARVGGYLVENLNGVETIKVNASEDYVMDKIETEYIKSAKIGFRSAKLSNLQNAFSTVLSGLGNLAILAIGGYLAIKGDITLGTLMAFMSLSSYFISPITRLVSMQLSIQEAHISLNRLGEIYDVEEENETEEDTDDSITKSGIKEISLNKVTFRYGSRQPVLTNVSITIPQNQKIALVGRSGCGKTTISKLLLKFYTAEEGTVTINGKDIKEIDAFALRDKIGCIPQTIQTFSGSIKDNILIGNPRATPSDFERACRLSGCDEFVTRLPKTYDTFLDENGGGLSGGEKQRIAIARALVKNPEFIILDEATSSMDFITEQKILETIYGKCRNTAMLIIAHRLSTIRWCDTIYVMDKGCVIESGTHDELLAKDGMYAEMWREQAGLSEKPVYEDEPDEQKKTPENTDDDIEYN